MRIMQETSKRHDSSQNPEDNSVFYTDTTFAENIHVEVYAHVINLVVDKTVVDGLKNTGHLSPYLKKIGSTALGMFCVSKSNNWILVFERSRLSIDIISHEVFHCVKAMLECKGVWPLTDSNEEAFAYLIGYLNQRVVSELLNNGEYIEMKKMFTKNHFQTADEKK